MVQCYEVPIRRFSTYIEFGDPQEVIEIPDWAEYWEREKPGDGEICGK